MYQALCLEEIGLGFVIIRGVRESRKGKGKGKGKGRIGKGTKV